MYRIKIIIIYMIALIVSYAAPTGFGARKTVDVTAFVAYQEPSIMLPNGENVVSSGVAGQSLNVVGTILLGITTYKPTGKGNDGTLYVKYRRKVPMTYKGPDGITHIVDFNTKLIDGGTDAGLSNDWKCEITIPFGTNTIKTVEYLITGVAPVAGQYEGRITFNVFYN